MKNFKSGEEVTFIKGAGWAAEAHVGTVIHVSPTDVTVRYETRLGPQVYLCKHSFICRGAVYWDGIESPINHLCRVEAAIQRQSND